MKRTRSGRAVRRAALSAAAVVVVTSTAHAAERARVDFSVNLAPLNHNASGFLHSIDNVSPSNERIAALKPQMFRDRPDGGGQNNSGGMFSQYPRLALAGVKHFQVVLSDGFNGDYSANGQWPGDGGSYAAWESYVTNMVQRVQQANAQLQLFNAKMEYDIWNEPDIGFFWKRDAATFREAWKRAVTTIRTLDPQATIVGPSFASYTSGVIAGQTSLKQFLLDAKADNALPNVLAWHDFSASGIPTRVTDARNFLAINGMNIERISLNEIVGTSTFDGAPQWQSAGPLPRYFLNVERMGVESAAHACWGGEAGGGDNCENGSLNGLLTSDTKVPRSTYWVYERYARMSGTLGQFTQGRNAVNLPTFDGLATRDDGIAHVLFGRTRDTDGSAVEVQLQNLDDVPNLVRAGAVRVTGETIVNSKTAASSGPIVTYDRIRRVTGGEVLVGVQTFGNSDGYFMTLQPLPTWKAGGDAQWWDPTAWDGGVPNGAGSAARLGPAGANHPTISVNLPTTVGLLTFDNPGGYRIAGLATLTLDNARGQAVIEAAAGANELDVAVRVTPGAPPLVVVADAASLKIGGGNKLTVAGIDLATTGALDLDGNDLLIDYTGTSPAASLRSLLQRGRNGGAWNGSGIRSSGIADDGLLALAYAQASDVALTEFAGAAVDETALLIRRTYAGDADLNGRLDGDDYFRIDSSFAGGDATWFNGDFDYNNRIDVDDYFVLDRNLGRQTFGVLAQGAATPVPEPAIGFLALTPFMLRRNRRRWCSRGDKTPIELFVSGAVTVDPALLKRLLSGKPRWR